MLFLNGLPFFVMVIFENRFETKEYLLAKDKKPGHLHVPKSPLA